ncbi:MAG: hypothetical protein HQ555_06635 [Candidatus Aminicenantes bacterium]|nr:hypothetical protein [Candidatus Aminicenantes bacterium]
MKKLIYLILVLSLFFYCGPKQEKAEKIMVDGVAHIKNPEKPLKGEVLLDIEQTLNINPYQYEEVDLGWFDFVRDRDGEVILFNSNKTEAQRFNLDGKYLGSLVRKGQGPGEFPDFQMFSVFFMNGQIWASGALKMAKYDKNGQFLHERRIGYRPTVFVDENTFFIEERINNKDGWLNKISLVSLSQDKEKENSELDFFHEKNVGMIQSKDGRARFAEAWGTPDIEYAYDQENQKLYFALNTQYKINVKNLKGETIHVIEKPYKHVKVNMEDKKKLLTWAKESEFGKWVLTVYPDTLVAIKDIKILPKGYLAVYRVSGVKTFEVDVFDQDGRFVYIIKPPQGVSLETVKFYSFGFAARETQEDELLVYTEYRIKNLPDIFQN